MKPTQNRIKARFGEKYMSKIDTYNTVKCYNKHAIEELRHALGQKSDGSLDGRNDKASLCAYDKAVWDTDMKLYIHASYGYYGSSSGYAVHGDILKGYLIMAINSYMPDIANRAIEYMNRGIEQARADAEQEAYAVLDATKV